MYALMPSASLMHGSPKSWASWSGMSWSLSRAFSKLRHFSSSVTPWLRTYKIITDLKDWNSTSSRLFKDVKDEIFTAWLRVTLQDLYRVDGQPQCLSYWIVVPFWFYVVDSRLHFGISNHTLRAKFPTKNLWNYCLVNTKQSMFALTVLSTVTEQSI